MRPKYQHSVINGSGVWEAVYILDGLMRYASDHQVHTDTQEQNEVAFGLSYFLGIELMSRVRNWKTLHFYKKVYRSEILFPEDPVDLQVLA